MASSTLVTNVIRQQQARHRLLLTTQYRSLMVPVEQSVEDFAGMPNPIALVSLTSAKAAGRVSMSEVCGGKIKVVTEDSCLASSVLLTYKANGGSAGELSGEAGASAVNKFLTFKSSEKAGSTLKTLRDMEDAGVMPIVKACRLNAQLGYTCAKDTTLDFVQNLALDSKYAKWDVAEAIVKAQTEAAVAQSNPYLMLTEGVYDAAYGDASPMSNSIYYGESGASRAGVMSFREREYYGGGDAIVAATGIEDHNAFVAAIADAFVGYGSDSVAAASGVYRGGEYRLATASGKAHVALAFAAPSDPVVCDILKHCLAASGCNSFAVDGVIGVYGDSDADGAAGLTDSLVEALATPVSVEQILSAKTVAKANALFALEASGSLSMAESLTLGAISDGGNDAQDLASLYDEVPAEMVMAAASALTKGNLTVSALGSISSVPYHATLSTKFI